MRKKSFKNQHIYLGLGGMLAVAALVMALTFGLSSAQDGSNPPPPPPSGEMMPPPGGDMPPPPSGGMMPPPGGDMPPPSGGMMPPPGGEMLPPPSGMQNQPPMGTQQTPCQPGQPCPTTSGMQGGQYPMGTQQPPCLPGQPCPPPSGMQGGQYPMGTQQPPCQPGQPCPPPSGMQGGQYPMGTQQPPCLPGQPCPPPSGMQGGQYPMGNQRPCGPSEQPSATNNCYMTGSMPGAGMPGTMRPCGPSEQPSPTNICQPMNVSGQQWQNQPNQPQNNCRPGDPSCSIRGDKGMRQAGQDQQNQPTFMQPGQCPDSMQSCPDQWNPSNTVCMPKKAFWDPKTNTSIPEGKDVGCDFFNSTTSGPGMQGGFGMPGTEMMNPGTQQGPRMMPQQGQYMQNNGPQTDPCMMNPNDPFCRAGMNFDVIQNQYQFDQTQFDPNQYKVNNSKQELSNLKREVSGWKNDLKQVNNQVAEIARSSNNFACPTKVEVESIATQLKGAIDTVSNLDSKTATKEDIQSALALRDFVNGKWENGQQTVEGLRQKLFGGPSEDGTPVPGKMQSLNACREISSTIQMSCEMYKNLSREKTKAEKGGAPKAILDAFAEVLPKLQQRCSDPLAILQEKNVSFDALLVPFEPDWDVCGDFMMFGPMMGGPQGGPMGGQMGGPQGNQMFGPQGGQFDQFNQGGFNPFGASVLSAQADNNFDNGDESGPQIIPDECKPPVQRYLGIDDLMQKMDSARRDAEKMFETTNVCQMLNMAKDYMDNSTVDNTGSDFGPPQEIVDMIEPGLAACENPGTEENSQILADIRDTMMNFGPGSGQGPMMGGDRNKGRFMGGMVDVEKLVNDKLNEKFKNFDLADTTDIKLGDYEKRISELTAKLNEAEQTILALSEKMSDMAAKLATAVEMSDKAKVAFQGITNMPNEQVQSSVASTLTDLASSAETVKKYLSAKDDKVMDGALNSLIQSPPSETVASEIGKKFVELQSYASSGADKKDVEKKVKSVVSEVAALNLADVGNKITSGIVATEDTADLSQWFAIPVLQAKNDGFVAKDLVKFDPSAPETKCAAITRVARVLSNAGDLTIDENNTTPVAGAPEWCRPFIHALANEGVDFVKTLKDPNASADRLDVAILFHQVLGDKLPDPTDMSKYMTPDMAGLPQDAQRAVAEMRFNGIMDTTDGRNFSPDAVFNRAQDALVSTKAFGVINNAK